MDEASKSPEWIVQKQLKSTQAAVYPDKVDTDARWQTMDE